MTDHVLFTLFGLPVTCYAACLVLAAVLSVLALLFSCRRENQETMLLFSVLTVPFCVIGARIVYCLANFDLYISSPADALYFWQGGYAIWGAIFGGAAACLMTAALRGMPCLRVMDEAAPAAALMIALSRASELFSGQGYGLSVEKESLCFFPLAVCNEYDEWHYAVFMLEALYALVILFILLSGKKALPEGTKARRMIILYSAGQILLENLRCDEYLNWVFGYLRISQLISALVLLSLLLGGLKKKKARGRSFVLPVLLFLLLAGVVVGAQFAMDKLWWMPVWACYAVVLLCSIGFGAITFRVVQEKV